MATRILLICLLFNPIFGTTIPGSKPGSLRVLEHYEQRLNNAILRSAKNAGRTVKRYKCVEEYVTFDEKGRTVSANTGARFTTTIAPTIDGTHNRKTVEREIRRKPSRKVTISMNHDEDEATTTSSPQSSVTSTTKSTLKPPLDELDDDEADRIIEEMYIRKKESRYSTPAVPIAPPTTHVSPTTLIEVSESAEIVTPVIAPPKIYKTIRSQTPIMNRGGGRRVGEEFDDFYGRPMRKQPVYNHYEDYDEIYYRRPFRQNHRRRRPILFASSNDIDGSNDDVNGNPMSMQRHHVTRDLSPLRQMRTIRRRLIPHHRLQQQPLAVYQTQLASAHSIDSVAARASMQPMFTPPIVPIAPPIVPATNNDEVLKMKPILQSNKEEMQEANEESCSKITALSKSFGIKDVSTWARSNCPILQAYAPNASCDLIFHFIDSCKKRKFF